MQTLPLRLNPGDDLRRSLEAAVVAEGCEAAFVLGGIGSLGPARLRMAGLDALTSFEGATEILTLSGTLGGGGSHLHMSVSDATGRVSGGHVPYGCVVRTTAEVLIALLPDWHFTRVHDAATGYPELVVTPRGGER